MVILLPAVEILLTYTVPLYEPQLLLKVLQLLLPVANLYLPHQASLPFDLGVIRMARMAKVEGHPVDVDGLLLRRLLPYLLARDVHLLNRIARLVALRIVAAERDRVTVGFLVRLGALLGPLGDPQLVDRVDLGYFGQCIHSSLLVLIDVGHFEHELPLGVAR